MQVIKRDGRIVDFNKRKISDAILNAMNETEEINRDLANRIANEISKLEVESLNVEEIQDIVEEKLMASKRKDVAKTYVRYRYKRELVREGNTTDKTIKELLNGESEYWNTENSNKNSKVVTVQRDYIAGITSTDIAKRFLIPKDVIKAHDEGIIHFHDMDYFAQKTLTNCCLINLEDMLQNGTVINEVLIEKPHRLITATTIATQIITAVTSSQYGGATITLSHLAPFVRDSYNLYVKKYTDRGLSQNQIEKFAKEDLLKEIQDSVQTFNYQCNSMTNTNGQAPFLTVFMYLNENPEYKEEVALLTQEFLNQRLLGLKNEQGQYITPAFPKLIYCLEEDNITEDGEYWWLTELSAKCTAKRLVPDYISEKKMLEYKIDKKNNGNVYPCMGCRSFLTPYLDDKGNPKYYGRFNCGVVTINLPYIALLSQGDMDKFWEYFEEYTELCHKALRCRVDRIKDTSVTVAPIMWQHGALGRLDDDKTIGDLMFDGYSTVSLGYAGLYECVKYMTGESHSQPNGEVFGLQVMQALSDKCTQWKKAEHLDYSPYGSPIESTTYKFAKALKHRFGEIEGITDRDYITNSYHIPVFEQIDPFSKLLAENKYQKLSAGGAISYVECADLTKNTKAVLKVMQFIYEHIMYAELNTKSDYCQVCGYDGEIQIKDENGKLYWECPNCGNTDQNKLNVARRTCGYIGTQFWNQGRTQEIKERYVHLDNHSLEE